MSWNLLKYAIFAAICEVDLTLMGSNIALTLSDWATKLYNNFKFPGFSEMLWDNSTSRHTIKQNVSRFLQVPELIDAF